MLFGRLRTSSTMVLLLGVACHRRPAPAVPVPPPILAEEHCWWAVVRSPLSPDTVAEHFASAFASVGLTNVRRAQVGDTIIVASGPNALAALGGALAESRIVAYPRGDSTHFRHFVALADEPTGRHLALCSDVTRAARVGAVAPRDPTGEETLAVWRRRPSGDIVRP